MKIFKVRHLATYIAIFALLYFFTDILPNVPYETLFNTIETAHNKKHVSAKQSEKIFMVIFIPSKPDVVKWRNHVRTKSLNLSSWNYEEFAGVPKEYLINKVMFVAGKSEENWYSEDLLRETSLHEDLYLIDTVESALALNSKLLFAMRRSLKIYDYSYFIKTDHDTLIDLPNLVRGLTATPKLNLYTGDCDQKLKSTPFNGTFDYCRGGGYVISRDLVEKITHLSDEEIGVAIPFEDGLAGWLVSQVVEKHKIRGAVIPKHDPLVLKNVADSKKFLFNRWFYHYLKTLPQLDRAYNCRIRANAVLCPSLQYKYLDQLKLDGSVRCVCDMH